MTFERGESGVALLHEELGGLVRQTALARAEVSTLRVRLLGTAP